MRTRIHTTRILGSVAAGFLAIIALSWIDEFTDFQYYIGGFRSPPNWREPAIESLIVLLVAISVIIFIKRSLSRLYYLEGLLSVCAWCKRVDHNGEWIPMDRFFERKFDTETSHGICKACSDELNVQLKDTHAH